MNFSSFLLAVAGVNDELMAQVSQRDKLTYQIAGAAFLINFALLLFVWGKVFLSNFGFWGLGPAFIFPLMFLILNMMALRTHRVFDGELAEYGQRIQETKKIPNRIRVIVAIIMSVSATLFFLESSSTSLIERKLQDDVNHVNQSLIQEYQNKAEALLQSSNYESSIASFIRSIKSLDKNIDDKNKDINKLIKLRNEYSKKEQESFNQIKAVCATRCEQARKKLAEINGYIKTAKQDLINLKQEKKILENSLQSNRDALVSIKSDAEKLASNYVYDLRYKQPLKDSFARTSAFLALFVDSNYAAGVWVKAVIWTSALLVVELMAILVIMQVPTNSYMVSVVTENMAQSMRMNVESERNAGKLLGIPDNNAIVVHEIRD